MIPAKLPWKVIGNYGQDDFLIGWIMHGLLVQYLPYIAALIEALGIVVVVRSVLEMFLSLNLVWSK